MQQNQKLIAQILKAVALGMATASIVLSIMNVITVETNVTLLGIGLFALALLSLQGVESSDKE